MSLAVRSKKGGVRRAFVPREGWSNLMSARSGIRPLQTPPAAGRRVLGKVLFYAVKMMIGETIE